MQKKSYLPFLTSCILNLLEFLHQLTTSINTGTHNVHPKNVPLWMTAMYFLVPVAMITTVHQ